MKKILTITLMAIASLFVGCSSWNETLTNKAKLEQICLTTQTVAQTTVSLVVTKNPDLKQWFLLGSNVIQVAFNKGTVQPTEIITLVDEALAKDNAPEEIRTTVSASITTILTLYSTVYVINIEGNMSDLTKSYIEILRSACNGIDIACGKTVTATANCNASYKEVKDYTIEDLTFNKE